MENQAINRRNFLGRTTLGLLSSFMKFPRLKDQEGIPGQNDKIVYRTLGKTKLKIPVVSFGVMNTDTPELIQRAIDMGIKHLDTANVYLRGNSERVIGRIVEESGKRNQLYIATKMRFARDRRKGTFLPGRDGNELGATEANFNKQLEESLQRLRTDYIDILYLHSCYSPGMATFEPMMKALVKAKEAGKARFIGISTHTDEPNVIRAAVDTGIYDVILTAYNFLQEHKDEVKKAIQSAADKGLGIIAMKTQAGGKINKKTDANHRAALKWVLQDKNICTTIPGMTTFEQLETNFDVMRDQALSAVEKRDLLLASQIQGTFFCQNCRSCILTCSARAEIPVLMRASMYLESYGNRIQAINTIEQLPRRLGLKACQGCSRCTARCPNGIEIRRRIQGLIDA